MPAAYTHYRFGKQVLEMLPENIRSEISRHRQLFDVGLQGADFFFYFRPWKKTDTAQLAYTYHRISGMDFFPAIISRLSGDEAQRVYLYGILAHYALDSHCHPYVDACTDEGKCLHAELEAEYDRICLSREGIQKPHRFPFSHHLRINAGDAARIAPLFPPATVRQIYESFTCFHLLYKALSSPLRSITVKLLTKASHRYLAMYDQPNTHVAGLIDEFDVHYKNALRSYPKLLDSLLHTMKTGSPLIAEFKPPFDLTPNNQEERSV